MPADEVTHGTGVDESRVRTGPRHAAPKKPLFTRFHMPAGKAIATVAMPTAVLMGMGFTSTLALADSNNTSSPTSKSLTADEYKDCVSALESSSPSASASASDDATDSATPSATASDDKKDSTSSSDTSSSSDSGSDDAATPTPSASKSSSTSGSSDSAGSSGSSDSGSTASPSPSASESSSSGGGLLDSIGDAISGILSGGTTTSTSSSSTATESATPSPSATSDSSSSDSSSSKDSGTSDTAKDTVSEAAKTVTDTVKDTTDTATKAADDATEAAADAATDTASPSASASASSSADDCPVATDDESGVDNKVPVADDPWYLSASSLLLKSADYQGVVEVKTASGEKKKVLKYVISGGTDIGDLHQTVKDSLSGKTYHVQAASGSTSTIRDGDTVMYTESISGNLFGLIPITFDPDNPPPLNIPLIYFTNVKVTQAGQFGGTLHVPGMHVYTTG
ncbi:hypothetical protein ABZ372_33875 [Streptomyces sp. NPDC005921]|uniref:hypothetical protein n=1 Tax=Streptomyces sp. NPDC005827 TaxID=3157070 RepID=UPI0033FC92D4